MFVFPHQKLIDHYFAVWYHREVPGKNRDSAKTKLKTKRKAGAVDMDAAQYVVDQLRLCSFPHIFIPEPTALRVPDSIKPFIKSKLEMPNGGIKVLQMTKYRRMIDIMVMLHFDLEKIVEIVTGKMFGTASFVGEDIREYVEWFFDWQSMDEPARSHFIEMVYRAREERVKNESKFAFMLRQDKLKLSTEFYHYLHCMLYSGQRSQEHILAAVDIQHESVDLSKIYESNCVMASALFKEALIHGDVEGASAWGKATREATMCYISITGGEPVQESLADFIKIVHPEDDKYSLTLEEIRRHNAIVLGQEKTGSPKA